MTYHTQRDVNGAKTIFHLANIITTYTQSHMAVAVSWGWNASEERRLSFQTHLYRLIYPYPCGGAVGWGTALQADRSRARFPDGVIGIFYWYNHSGPHYDSGVDSGFNRNE